MVERGDFYPNDDVYAKMPVAENETRETRACSNGNRNIKELKRKGNGQQDQGRSGSLSRRLR